MLSTADVCAAVGECRKEEEKDQQCCVGNGIYDFVTLRSRSLAIHWTKCPQYGRIRQLPHDRLLHVLTFGNRIVVFPYRIRVRVDLHIFVDQ